MMRSNFLVMTTSVLTLAIGFAANAADTPAAQPKADAPKGEIAMATVTVTATVAKIDHKTREVTLKSDAGKEYTFIASEDVKNLPQVKVGDVVTATYGEALAYEVKKGGKMSGPTVAAAGGTAEPGAKPAGAIARQTTATVLVTAIDPKAPSITFQGPRGNTRTIKVLRPEKLQGVSVGDTVDLTFTEAVALKVEDAPQGETKKQ